MSAPTKVSEPQIGEALRIWRGTVADAARALAISENALRKRMKAMGIGPDALSLFRRQSLRHQPQPSIPTPTKGPTIISEPTVLPPNEGHNWSESDRASMFSNVSTDVVLQRPQTKPPKLRPDQVDRLRDFKFDYQARHRIEADEGDLLRRFFDEDFADWVRRTMASLSSQSQEDPKPKRKEGER